LYQPADLLFTVLGTCIGLVVTLPAMQKFTAQPWQLHVVAGTCCLLLRPLHVVVVIGCLPHVAVQY
jgi:hypothetical protein